MEFKEIRRKDRVWDNDQARELLEKGEYGFLAMCDPEGYGYGIPVSYIVDSNKIYIHCAPEGHKLDSIGSNPKVSFCVVGSTQVDPARFTTAYESVHLFGLAHVVQDDEERLHALRLIVRKYSPDFIETAEKYIRGSFQRTAVIRIDIEHLSAKCKRIPAGSHPL